MAAESDSIPPYRVAGPLPRATRIRARTGSLPRGRAAQDLLEPVEAPSGDRYWSTARDNAELQRLGFLNAGPFSKDLRSYEQMRENNLKVTDEGRQILDRFLCDRAEAYDNLFCRMYATHPYLQSLVKALLRSPIHAPALTSFKQHVSDR